MEGSTEGKEKSPDGLTLAWAYHHPRSLLPEAVDELPN